MNDLEYGDDMRANYFSRHSTSPNRRPYPGGNKTPPKFSKFEKVAFSNILQQQQSDSELLTVTHSARPSTPTTPSVILCYIWWGWGVVLTFVI